MDQNTYTKLFDINVFKNYSGIYLKFKNQFPKTLPIIP